MEQRQVFDLTSTFALLGSGVRRLLGIEPIGAQPVDTPGIGCAKVLGILDGQQAFADPTQPSELNHHAGVFVIRDTHRGERGVDAPEFLQPADEP
jgi:hypothetical protein